MNFTNYEEMAAMILFGIGFTTLLLHKNMIKKIIGFSMMDSAIYLFLAVKGYIAGRKAPIVVDGITSMEAYINPCLLYTSPRPRDGLLSRMPSSA